MTTPSGCGTRRRPGIEPLASRIGNGAPAQSGSGEIVDDGRRKHARDTGCAMGKALLTLTDTSSKITTFTRDGRRIFTGHDNGGDQVMGSGDGPSDRRAARTSRRRHTFHHRKRSTGRLANNGHSDRQGDGAVMDLKNRNLISTFSVGRYRISVTPPTPNGFGRSSMGKNCDIPGYDHGPDARRDHRTQQCNSDRWRAKSAGRTIFHYGR